MQTIDTRRPVRNDTFDLRGQMHPDDQMMEVHGDAANYAGTDDEEHSVLEDDSDGEERDDYMDEDDDGSSSLSIPNESIDFDLVYSLHSFAATVEGQANVVKGDSLFLMDDSNSYWWLVRVLKTQEVGYIPAENIETPFERLARLNKHRNVDLASATQTELQDGLNASQDRLRNNLNSRQGQTQSPSPIPNRSRSRQTKSVIFIPQMSVHRYPPAVWHSEDEDEDGEDVEWDDEGYEGEDPELAAEAEEMELQRRLEESQGMGAPAGMPMEMDDGVAWDDAAAKEMQQARQAAAVKAEVPASLRPSAGVADQQALQAQQQQQQQQIQIQQQRQRELVAQQQQAQQQSISPEQALRPSNSRERLPGTSPTAGSAPQDSPTSTSSASGHQRRMDPLDPLDRQETVRMTMTPTIAREADESASASQLQAQIQAQAQTQRQEEERKRVREEDSEDSLRKKAKGKEKMGAPVSSATYAAGGGAMAGGAGASGGPSSGGKLRKERDTESDDSKDKKKKGGVFGGLFGRRKDKDKKEKSGSISSLDVSEGTRVSEESSRTGGRPSNGSGSIPDGMMSPTTQIAMQQQQQQQATALRNSMDPRRLTQQNQGSPQGPGQGQGQQSPATPPHQVSQHASQLRQRDQQQQALYQQYLNRSPSSPPELQPSYGLQSASAINNSYHHHSSGSGLGPPTNRPRPGSLILTPGLDGSGPLPELSVIRVFAGDNLQTDATFKTVLLNSSTTSADLVRQAIQRFRLPGSSDAEEAGEYYLTVKQVEGSSAVLRDTEKPLVVFETLVEEAKMELELPRVKRSSVGSISSVSSNLSMHPAIRKLPMNDFTDDSAVKIYLNRKGVGDAERSYGEGDDTLIAADVSITDSESGIASPRAGNFLTVSTASDDVSSERFSSPSFRFALQLVIYADDLPDDMVFDPLTEAIVFKDTLRERDRSSGGNSSQSSVSGGVSQKLRKKVFVFPKNVTVAEVIELGLERFGILDGVVDGGDEVEDKLAKRRSSSRVRYGLSVSVDGGQEKELSPSSKVIDAFPRPPTYRAVDRRFQDTKRRSVDSAQLLGTLDDVSSTDPTFILRRATSYRNSSSRHRMSAPLDEIALRSLHRESASSAGSEPLSPSAHEESFNSKQKGLGQIQAQQGPSRKEIIAAQREASRANQRAILSTQTNSVRGVDVLLPGNVRLRSSRYTTDDKMRYSYVQSDGESYDISDIIEEEWKRDGGKGDLLEGVVGRGGRDAAGNVGEKLDRVLNKIKDGKGKGSLAPTQQNVSRASPVSEYSVDETVEAEPTRSRSITPVGARPVGQSQMVAGRVASPASTIGRSTPDEYRQQSRPGTTTPTAGKSSGTRRNPSIASVMSDMSGYETAGTHPVQSPTETRGPTPTQTPSSPRRTRQQKNISAKHIHIPKDDFGVSQMLAVIEYRAMKTKPKSGAAEIKKEGDEVEEMLFGKKLDLGSLHPKVRDLYADSFKKMDEMDEVLDDYLQRALAEKS